MAAEVGGNEAAASAKPKLKLLDLPVETQHGILSYCPENDLISVALVSRHFHNLASAILYRNFHIVFPDEDGIGFEDPIDGLAAGLETFTTSDYNYAKHLRDLCLDTLSSGAKGEAAYQAYLYSSSCGKFLNTLILLMLKQATSLESFKWNIRVELSRPVYRELHRLSSLKKLHLRMQAGESCYAIPPPLPLSGTPIDHMVSSSQQWHGGLWGTSGPLTAMLPGSGTGLSVTDPASSLLPPSQSRQKDKAKRGSASKEPPTLSGFKNLKSLCVLDIEDLDLVTELKTCLKNSSATLTELQLSLSDSLASQARRPLADSDAEDSDIDDDFQVAPASQNTSQDGSGPAQAFRAQAERKLQESVLSQIFDLEPHPIPAPKVSGHSRNEEEILTGETKVNPEFGDSEMAKTSERAGFIKLIRDVADVLEAQRKSTTADVVSPANIAAMIVKAFQSYVVECKVGGTAHDSPDTKTPEPNQSSENSQGTSSGQTSTVVHGEDGRETSNAGTACLVVVNEDNANLGSESVESDSAGRTRELQTISKGKGPAIDMKPEDIDIEHLETLDGAFDDTLEAGGQGHAHEAQLPDNTQIGEWTKHVTESPDTTGGDDMAASGEDGPASSKNEDAPPSAQDVQQSVLTSEVRGYFDMADELMRTAIEGFGEWDATLQQLHLSETLLALEVPQTQATQERLKDMRASISKMKAERDALSKKLSANFEVLQSAEMQDVLRRVESREAARISRNMSQTMEDYIRETRGISLEVLSIELIPVKASVLSRAINLQQLRQLTLLNVGNQVPIWSMLAKENQSSRLPLRSIFTDSVSSTFLKFASQLEELHELFMLERNESHKPESLAPKATVTIDQIRRLVLKKHSGTLRRLMIKDDSNRPRWDLDEKTMMIICTRGVKLEELAVGMHLNALHTFMQYFSGLTNLRAVHIMHVHGNDMDLWLMREVLRFIVDTLSHQPELKLKWIATENNKVHCVVRPEERAQKRQKKSKKPDRAKGKGKSKVPALWMNSIMTTSAGGSVGGVLDGVNSGDESSSDEDDESDGGCLRFGTTGPHQFYHTSGIKIFDKEIRSGRL